MVAVTSSSMASLAAASVMRAAAGVVEVAGVAAVAMAAAGVVVTLSRTTLAWAAPPRVVASAAAEASRTMLTWTTRAPSPPRTGSEQLLRAPVLCGMLGPQAPLAECQQQLAALRTAAGC